MNTAGAVSVVAMTQRYGSATALHEVTVQVESGSILALLGPNGAGKATLVRTVTTLLRSNS